MAASSSPPDASHLWMHLTSLSNRSPLRLVRGQGSYVYDADDRRYLDALAGNFCVQVGYGRDELANAAFAQLKELPFVRNVAMTTDVTLELANQLATLSGLE